MFDGFDFKLLDDPVFKEDSVREELVVPILKRLGYSASGADKIIRSEPLLHPFVSIGTKAHKINIFPDYQLAPAGKKGWVLDAKGPNEEIRRGQNVEQAYSYAIHPDVRVPLYGLCNGRELVVFHVSEVEPKLAIGLQEIDARWKEVHDLLCPLAFTNPKVLNYLPDFGLRILKSGHAHVSQRMFFPHLGFNHVGKAKDDLYTLVSNFEMDEAYCAAFDLTPDMYKEFLEAVTPAQRKKIEAGLSQHPWSVYFESQEDAPHVTVGAIFAGYVMHNEDEDYAPLQIVEIRK